MRHKGKLLDQYTGNYLLHHEVAYDGETTQCTHKGRVYNLHAIGYTYSVLFPPFLRADEDLPVELEKKYPPPEYYITDGFSGATKEWFKGNVSRETYEKTASVWLVWKWVGDVLKPPKTRRGNRLSRLLHKGRGRSERTPTSLRGVR